jgi:hypothetical protein
MRDAEKEQEFASKYCGLADETVQFIISVISCRTLDEALDLIKRRYEWTSTRSR